MSDLVYIGFTMLVVGGISWLLAAMGPLKEERGGYVTRWGEDTFFQCPWWRPNRMRKQAIHQALQDIDDPDHEKIHTYYHWK